MVLTLYKLDSSPPNRVAMIACELFDVPVKMVDVDLFAGDHLKPEFVKKNPTRTIPVLEDGDLILHDSHTMLMYLADVYGKDDSLYPKDPKQRALVNQKLIFNGTVIFTRMRNITYPLIMKGNKDISQAKLNAVDETYGFLEEFLNRTKFLAGDNITIADIAAFVTTTGLLLLLPLNSQKYPKTQAWLEEIEKLPAVQKHHPKGQEEFRQLLETKLSS